MFLYRHFFKRFLDIILSLLALVVLSPLLMILAVSVRIKLGKPVLFSQKRPGKNEKIFTLYKFRTMTDLKDSDSNLLSDGERLTCFGKFLRSTSLDELPELFNILRGNMSIVGPRPLLVQYLNRYSGEQKRRHEIRPGFTGWAQVNGRNAISWEAKFSYDVWYVDNVSLWLDVKIIFRTLMVVFKRTGVNSESSETMEEFKGYF